MAGINSGRKGARSWLVRAVAKVNVEVASRYYLRFVARGGKSEDYLAPRKWFAKVFTRWWREVETKRARYTSGIVFIPWCRFFLFLFPSSSSHRFSPARGFLPSREFDTNSIQDARSLSKENLFHSLINNVLNFSFQGLLTLSLLRFSAQDAAYCTIWSQLLYSSSIVFWKCIASIFLIIVKAIWIAARRSFSSTVHVFGAAENERVKLFVRCYSRMETLHLDGAFPCSFRIVRSLVTFCRHR